MPIMKTIWRPIPKSKNTLCSNQERGDMIQQEKGLAQIQFSLAEGSPIKGPSGGDPLSRRRISFTLEE